MSEKIRKADVVVEMDMKGIDIEPSSRNNFWKTLVKRPSHFQYFEFLVLASRPFSVSWSLRPLK